jgi:PTS system mannose-specific IIC component
VRVIGLPGFLVLVLVGALCALDTVSVLQAMVSRPIVSATVAGAMLGRAEDGVVVGAVLELFALETLPFGASRYPEWGSAGVVAATAYVLGGAHVAGALALATLAGLATAGFGSVSMVWHRRFVARMAEGLREPLAAGSATAVTRLHMAGIASDLWRGAIVTAVALVVTFALTGRLLAAWRLGYGPSVAWPVTLAVAVGGAAIVRSARAVPRASWFFAGGAVVGLGLVLVR